jgi:hypothetical protein
MLTRTFLITTTHSSHAGTGFLTSYSGNFNYSSTSPYLWQLVSKLFSPCVLCCELKTCRCPITCNKSLSLTFLLIPASPDLMRVLQDIYQVLFCISFDYLSSLLLDMTVEFGVTVSSGVRGRLFQFRRRLHAVNVLLDCCLRFIEMCKQVFSFSSPEGTTTSMYPNMRNPAWETYEFLQGNGYPNLLQNAAHVFFNTLTV